MSEDIEGYLQAKGLAVKRAGPTDVHVACMYCQEDPSKRGRLYINTDPNAEPPGLHFCHLCGTRGALNKLRKHFGDPILRDSNDEQTEASYKRHGILQEAAAYYHEKLGENEEAFHYLRYERGLTVETMMKHELGWADGTLKKHLMDKGFFLADIQETGMVDRFGRDFLYAHITIPYHVNGNVVLIRGKEINSKYLTPSGQKTRLFNTDVCWTADQLVITEGEFDALVLEQYGYNAVGAPGASSWQDGWKEYFTGARKVYICFDNDDAGNAGAEKIARLVGPSSRVVKMPEAQPGGKKNDPTEWIVQQGHTKDDFQMLLVKARGGYLLSVYDGYDEWLGRQGAIGLEIGIEAIDSKLKPGLLPTQVMIVLAKTGTGKTVFTQNIFQRMVMANPEVKILFVSLEQTRSDWFEKARRIYRFYNLSANDQDCLPFFEKSLLLMDKNRISEEELVHCLEQYEFELGEKPDLVAIDYLGYWARSYKGEPYERTSTAVMALKAIAKEHNVAIFAPHQVSRIAKFGENFDAGASRDSGVVEETADFLLSIVAPDRVANRQAEERTGVVKLRILKSRHGGDGTEAQVQFAPLSLAMIPFGDPLVGRAQDEHHMAMKRDDFEEAIYRHRTGIRDLSLPAPEELNG